MSELEFLERRKSLLTAEIAAIDERMLQLQADQEENLLGLPKMYTVQRAADETGISYDFVRKLCLRGKVKYIKAGSKFLVNMGSLYVYLNQGETNGDS